MVEKEDENSIIFKKLNDLDQQAQRQVEQLNLESALAIVEKTIQMRFEFYGENSGEIIRYIGGVLKNYTAAAQRLLDANQVDNCLKALKNLEEIAFITGDPSNFVAEKCQIFNSIAMVYTHVGKIRIGQKYLEKALNLGNVFKDVPMDLASPHLNMCHLLSGEGQHPQALSHARQAVKYAQKILISEKIRKRDCRQSISTLAMAYHSLGREEDCMRNYRKALAWFKKSISFLQKYGQPAHQHLMVEFTAAYKNARDSFAEAQKANPNLRLANKRVNRQYSMINSYFQEEEDSDKSVQKKTHMSDSEVRRKHFSRNRMRPSSAYGQNKQRPVMSGNDFLTSEESGMESIDLERDYDFDTDGIDQPEFVTPNSEQIDSILDQSSIQEIDHEQLRSIDAAFASEDQMTPQFPLQPTYSEIAFNPNVPKDLVEMRSPDQQTQTKKEPDIIEAANVKEDEAAEVEMPFKLNDVKPKTKVQLQNRINQITANRAQKIKEDLLNQRIDSEVAIDVLNKNSDEEEVKVGIISEPISEAEAEVFTKEKLPKEEAEVITEEAQSKEEEEVTSEKQPSKEEEVQPQTQCLICNSKFDYNRLTPHRLPCDHVVCLFCITKSLRHTIQCPVCCSEFEIPSLKVFPIARQCVPKRQTYSRQNSRPNSGTNSRPNSGTNSRPPSVPNSIPNSVPNSQAQSPAFSPITTPKESPGRMPISIPPDSLENTPIQEIKAEVSDHEPDDNQLSVIPENRNNLQHIRTESIQSGSMISDISIITDEPSQPQSTLLSFQQAGFEESQNSTLILEEDQGQISEEKAYRRMETTKAKTVARNENFDDQSSENSLCSEQSLQKEKTEEAAQEEAEEAAQEKSEEAAQEEAEETAQEEAEETAQAEATQEEAAQVEAEEAAQEKAEEAAQEEAEEAAQEKAEEAAQEEAVQEEAEESVVVETPQYELVKYGVKIVGLQSHIITIFKNETQMFIKTPKVEDKVEDLLHLQQIFHTDEQSPLFTAILWNSIKVENGQHEIQEFPILVSSQFMQHLDNKFVKVFLGYDQGFQLLFQCSETPTLALGLDYLSHELDFPTHQFRENLDVVLSKLEFFEQNLIFEPDPRKSQANRLKILSRMISLIQVQQIIKLAIDLESSIEQIEEESEEPRPGEQRLQIGVNISGTLHIVSVFSLDNGMRLEAQDPNTSKMYEVEAEEDYDASKIHYLLKRLYIRDDELQIATKRPPIIYKRSHFISNRYFIITVTQEFTGLHFSAYEPDVNQTLFYTLNKKTGLENTELTMLELPNVIRSLEVVNFLGEETLLLNLKHA